METLGDGLSEGETRVLHGDHGPPAVEAGLGSVPKPG